MIKVDSFACPERDGVRMQYKWYRLHNFNDDKSLCEQTNKKKAMLPRLSTFAIAVLAMPAGYCVRTQQKGAEDSAKKKKEKK